MTRPMRMPDIEELIPDERIERAEEIVRKAVPSLPEDAQFIAWLEPKGEVVKGDEAVPVPERAVFSVMSPHPRHPEFQLTTCGGMWLQVWRDEDRMFQHFVGKIDPAITVFTIVAREHAEKVKNMREISN